jgi:hypothetical protein
MAPYFRQLLPDEVVVGSDGKPVRVVKLHEEGAQAELAGELLNAKGNLRRFARRDAGVLRSLTRVIAHEQPQPLHAVAGPPAR